MNSEQIDKLLQQHKGAKQLHDALKEYEWNTEEDALFVGIVVSRYIVDLMGH